MSFNLDKVIPWGRSLAEYKLIFSLTEKDLKRKILGCGDGPASFNAELNQTGGDVISVDPIYKFSAAQIQERVEAVYDEVLSKVEENKNEFVWSHVKSVADLGRLRMNAMNSFLVDYQVNKERYLDQQLPSLSFNSKEFDLALCSHFLFLYSEHHSLDFHKKAIEELCRVATEVRIFPVLELGSVESRHLKPLMKYFRNSAYFCELQQVEYEFQKGGNQMLVLRAL